MMAISASEHLTATGNSYAWRYKSDWLNEVSVIALSHGVDIRDSKLLEIGAGIHNPLGCALDALARGAKQAVAIEPSPLIPDHLQHAIMLGLISNYKSEQTGVLFRPALEHVIGTASKPSGGSIKTIGLELFNGSIENYETTDAFDIVHSNAVIEHVLNLQAACRRLVTMTAPGGLHIHKVDFIDHRYYKIANPQPMDAFRFLLRGHETAAPDCNGLRMSEVIRTFAENGFDYLGSPQAWQLAFPSGARDLLQDRYRNLTDADIATTCAILVFKVPG